MPSCRSCERRSEGWIDPRIGSAPTRDAEISGLSEMCGFERPWNDASSRPAAVRVGNFVVRSRLSTVRTAASDGRAAGSFASMTSTSIEWNDTVLDSLSSSETLRDTRAVEHDLAMVDHDEVVADPFELVDRVG